VKREEVEERIVFDVTLVKAKEALKAYCAKNHRGVAC